MPRPATLLLGRRRAAVSPLQPGLYVAGSGSWSGTASGIGRLSGGVSYVVGDGLQWDDAGAAGEGYSLARRANGNLVCAGTFMKSGAKTVRGIAEWDGFTWTELGTDGLVDSSYIGRRCLAIGPDDTVYSSVYKYKDVDGLGGTGYYVVKLVGTTWVSVSDYPRTSCTWEGITAS